MKYVCMDDGFYIAMCTITGVTLQFLLLSFVMKPLNSLNAYICSIYLFIYFFWSFNNELTDEMMSILYLKHTKWTLNTLMLH